MPPERVAVVGTSGSGKTTCARTLAARLGVPHVELDALYHGPGWLPVPAAEFRARVDARCPAQGRWVVDGNYSAVADLTRGRADEVVWLDPPRRVVLLRVMRRTLGRAIRRTALWNGNRESLRNLVSRDPEINIVLWAWTRHAHYRSTYEAERDERWVRRRL